MKNLSTKLLMVCAVAGLSAISQSVLATPIYAVQPNGDLLFYKHTGTYNGALTWPVSGAKIGNGWTSNVSRVFAGNDGSIYVVRTNGDLSFYRHTGTDNGAATWPVQNAKIGTGWNAADIVKVFAGEDGSIYIIKTNGDLFFYKYTGTYDGTFTWPVTGKKIGSGWNIFKQVFAGDNGAIYGIKPNGDLLFYRHTGTYDGAFSWPVTNAKIGTGWNIFKQVFAGDDGSIYGVKLNGDMLFYKYTGAYDGSFSWPVTNVKIGHGWNFNQVFSSQ